jgi:hypothetical protein
MYTCRCLVECPRFGHGCEDHLTYDPVDCTERRFAAGEIDRADFEERKQLLSRS